jgi:hypothetical protein
MNTPNESTGNIAGQYTSPTARPPVSHPPALPGQSYFNQSFATDYAAIPGRLTAQNLLERLLKMPASVVYELTRGRRLQAGLVLALVAVVCFVAYGFIIGTFSGGGQLWMVPVKLLLGVILSAVLCLPSLYIFSCFSGGRQSLSDTVAALVLGLALWSILLVGFAPIAWLFSQSTDTVAFMGALHVLFWGVAAWFALDLMNSALAQLNDGRTLTILRLWGVLFFVVTMQVAVMVRPLIGKAAPLQLGEKKFFLTHWSNCIEYADKDEK